MDINTLPFDLHDVLAALPCGQQWAWLILISPVTEEKILDALTNCFTGSRTFTKFCANVAAGYQPTFCGEQPFPEARMWFAHQVDLEMARLGAETRCHVCHDVGGYYARFYSCAPVELVLAHRQAQDTLAAARTLQRPLTITYDEW